MSNKTVQTQWIKTQVDLEKSALLDFEQQAADPEPNRVTAQSNIYEIYIKYILLSNRLDEVYDKMVQPQKRLLIRKLLDACLGRVLELKADLVNLDMVEFNYNDEVIEKLNLTSFDLEVNIPKYFRRERETEIKGKQKFIEEIMKRQGIEDEEVIEEVLTEMEAIRVIQTHERARQGRLRAQFMKEIRLLKDKGKLDGAKEGAALGIFAAMKIQKVWRGFVQRRQTRRRKIEEMILIGMIPPMSTEKSVALLESEQIIKMRYNQQKRHQEEYEQRLLQIKNEICLKQGTHITEGIADEIRTWFHEYHVRTGKFPDFPSDESGGSRHLLSRQGTESELSRSLSSKDSKKQSKDKQKGGDVPLEEAPISGFKATQSQFLPEVKLGIDQYNDVWRDKDESENFHQQCYDEMIYAEKYGEVEMDLRKIVDEIMRQELEMLQQALDRDRAAKGKKSKKSAKKARRSGKKSKKKKEKDLTPDRTTESLFEELISNGIIKKYPETTIKSYIGDISYVARSGVNPTTGDIRQLIKEYCILPLGSETVHLFAPCIKSILLAGPKGSGKKSLVHAVCTEVGAVLFDLSPSNIVGKYPGKSGLIMLMHLISKVSRLLQPSVIYFDNAEKPFMKKIPKTDRTDPKRLKKDLPKLIKSICAEDRVILIGSSTCPWDADQKLLQQTYNHYVYIPRPDYGTLSFAWKELLGQYSGIHKTFDSGAMAKISDGYTIGAVVRCIREVITCKRMLQLRVQPLTHIELINSLSSKDPVYAEEEEAFDMWWAKTPLGRKKQKTLDLELEAKLENEKEGGKKKQKGKK